MQCPIDASALAEARSREKVQVSRARQVLRNGVIETRPVTVAFGQSLSATSACADSVLGYDGICFHINHKKGGDKFPWRQNPILLARDSLDADG